MLSIFYLLGVMVFFFMLWLMMLLIMTSNPTSALLFFMGVVISSMYLFYCFLGDMLSYLIFLVYVGGLLVLLIYMVMMSSNTLFNEGHKAKVLFGFSTLLGVVSYITDPDKNVSCPVTNFGISFEPTLLALMGLFLFFLFVCLCNVISVGGRSVNIGNIT